MKIGDPIFEQLKTFMDYSTRKQKLINSNLANAVTPGYKAKELSFGEFLKNEKGSGSLSVSDPGHIQSGPKLVKSEAEVRDSKDSMGPDGNNVDLEKEITGMAQNVLKFSVVSRFFHQKLVMVRNSIKEGKP
jgi:flagellar basal-body rod protein FlgB